MTRLDLIRQRAERRKPVGMENFGHVLGIAFAAGRVRDAQKVYFADRTQANLIESKRLEKELDDLLGQPAEPWMDAEER